MMFCIDSTYSKQFHVLTADLIDCPGVGSDLIKIFNHLGICVSVAAHTGNNTAPE